MVFTPKDGESVLGTFQESETFTAARLAVLSAWRRWWNCTVTRCGMGESIMDLWWLTSGLLSRHHILQ